MSEGSLAIRGNPASTKRLVLPVLALAGWWAGACDSGNPVVPDPPEAAPVAAGDSFTLGLGVNPAELVAGSGVPGTVTVTAVRTDNGQPPDDGTLVSVSTDNGTLSGDVTLVTLGLSGGSATTSLFPAADPGTANLVAQLSADTAQATVEFVAETSDAFFVSAVEPQVGSSGGGDEVTVSGGGFQAPLTVAFGGGQGTVGEVTSSTITVLTPPSAMPVASGESLTVDVVVTNALDSASPPAATLAGGFIYAAEGETPVFLTGISPSSGTADGGTQVTLSGGRFEAPVQVDFGGSAGIGPEVNDEGTAITVTTPPSPMPVAAGENLAVDVTVTSGLDQESPQTASLPGGFVFEGEASPTVVTVSAISPTEGPFGGGTEVTVTGQGFAAPVAVELGGIRQAGEVVDSASEVRFTTAGVSVGTCPADGQLPQTGVTVTNLATGDAGTGNLTFTYTVPVPRIDRVAPTFGPQAGNSLVTLQGDDFVAPVRVVFSVGGEEFAAVVQSVDVLGTPEEIQVASPGVPDSVLPETDCTTTDSMPGKVFGQVTADVKVINFETGCEDTFANAFTYDPSDTSCRQVSSGDG